LVIAVFPAVFTVYNPVSQAEGTTTRRHDGGFIDDLDKTCDRIGSYTTESFRISVSALDS
jgi:hypothetical protein